MTVGADVFMNDGFTATGGVNLMRAQITGDLRCANAEFNGDLDCEGMKVGGGMYWQDVATSPRIINLTDAYVGALQDDVESWQRCLLPVLNGFRYDRIISEVTVRERLAWLGRKFERQIIAAVQTDGEPLPWLSKQGDKKFDPQPYSQLATTLRAQGNVSGAGRVLMEREKRLRRAGYLRAQAGLDGYASSIMPSIQATLKLPFDGLFGLVFGYGHRPMRAFVAVFLIWLSCFWLYGAAFNAGQMAPNSDVVLTSAEWLNAAEKGCSTVKEAGCDMPLHLWNITDTATDYETFNRGLYALDLFVPLDALGQENAWAPSKDRGALGWWAYYMRWVVQMAGWVITAVGAAALTGVIGRKE